MNFKSLGLSKEVQQALKGAGYQQFNRKPFPLLAKKMEAG